MGDVDPCAGYQLREPADRTSWSKNPFPAPIPTRHQIWDHHLAGIRVISTIEFTEPARGVEYHLSISERGGRYPAPWVIEKVRKDFCAEAFEQDDHQSKVAHLWLPVEKDKRGDCDCEDLDL